MTDEVWTKRAQQIVEVSSSPPDTDPVWVDISDYVLTVGSGQPSVTGRGRQTELTQGQQGQLTLALNNDDGRFTPDNPLSPYVSWWKQGREIRYQERIGPFLFPLFRGYLQLPEVVIQTEDVDQVLNVSAVDRLARLDQPGTEFVSTLAAYISATGGSALKAYYPMGDPNEPFLDQSGNNYPAPVSTVTRPTPPSGAITGAPAVVPSSVSGPAGDDQSAPAFTFAYVGTTAVVITQSLIDLHAANRMISIAAGETLTLVAWVNADPSAGVTLAADVLLAYLYQAGSFLTLAGILYDASGATESGNWYANGGISADLVGSKAVSSHWLPVALRITWSPTQTIEFWQADLAAQSGTWAAGAPSDLSLGLLYIVAGAFAGSVEHVQVYVGDSTAYTHSMFLAQMQMGLSGLERQTTGERVNSILDYAGVPAHLRDIDPGTAVMATASLAGKTPLAALREAERTERGLLFCDGQGRVCFRDRNRRYNL